MPVGYPAVYSVYLAKKQGPFATLGLAEDTWALNEHVSDDDQFLQQCLDIDREREAMFFDALDKVRAGLVVCVFDGTDRLQHMFWRDIDAEHPARPDPELLARPQRDRGSLHADGRPGRQDDGEVPATGHAADGDLRPRLRPVPPGVDLNRWLEENGYLVLDDGRGGEEHLAGVDWSRTRAFAIGLTGIFINLKDKYAQGIVEPGGEADRLRDEIAERLEALVDPATGRAPSSGSTSPRSSTAGPYKDNAPDLIVGYQRGYRVSWEAAIGRTTEAVFHANKKAWSGDHCVDPSLVPGILFCNHPIASENPRLIDIAPTVLSMFGVAGPRLHGRQGADGRRRAGHGAPARTRSSLAEVV